MDKEIAKQKDWSTLSAIDYYNIHNWGSGYFTVNEKGNLTVQPYGETGPRIDIMDVVDEIRDKKLSFPCVVRFQDILRSRVELLIRTFEKHIKEMNYGGAYFGVYPIKVNQMREVVEEILDAGAFGHLGLEAGSKGELLSVLAYNTDLEALTICNGFKDEEYVRLALLGRKLDRKVIVVIEKLSELPELLRLAEEMKVEPHIGLPVPEIIQATDLLKSLGKMECLKLFHFHAGSQLTDMRVIKEAMNEGARMYAKLCKMGFPVEYFDVGGGLGVDYEGANSTSQSSMNYTMDEYIADLIYNLQQICKDEEVPEPHIVSESGRAVTAHHSCIIIPVFGSIQLGHDYADILGKSDHSQIVTEMRKIFQNLSDANIQESYHDANAKKEDALASFRLGILDLEERAKVEALYWQICRKILELRGSRKKKAAKETSHLKELLADQYLANFSVFQSAPDHWAFGQLFPLVPLHRLNENPSRRGTLVDITCDSDGKIAKFIDAVAPKNTLWLHDLKPGEPYYIGLFMLGAYQDIMGDMHNLFGRVNEVHVFCDDEDPEDFYLEEVIPGDSISDVLVRLQYFPSELAKSVKKAVDERIKSGVIKPKEGMTLIEFYEGVMKSYTYLETGRTPQPSFEVAAESPVSELSSIEPLRARLFLPTVAEFCWRYPARNYPNLPP